MLNDAFCPSPALGESPISYADRIGRWHNSISTAEQRKRLGQFFTPPAIASHMASYAESDGSAIRILDPAAGAGILIAALCEQLASRVVQPQTIEVEAYEVDSELATCLTVSLRYMADWLSRRGIVLRYNIYCEDFILRYASVLDHRPSLIVPLNEVGTRFDIVIANPPYFKLSNTDPRARAAASVVHGQSNIYALFMAVAARLLRSDGRLIVITPRSYTSGSYFRRFRKYFFSLVRPVALHVFGSRRAAFSKDEILQENLILVADQADGRGVWPVNCAVEVSESDGVQDLGSARRRWVHHDRVVDLQNADLILHVPTDEELDITTRQVQSWPGRLGPFGLRVSTGPVVAFRAATHLRGHGELNPSTAPLLWLQNVSTMQITWPSPINRKPQFIDATDNTAALMLQNRNYVIIRRFTAKEEIRRLVAAPYDSTVIPSLTLGIENHLNYICRPTGNLSIEEAYGLAGLLSSSLYDMYFRSFNGNTQVSATELRSTPLPPLEAITEIGHVLLNWDEGERRNLQTIDRIVGTILGMSQPEFQRKDT